MPPSRDAASAARIVPPSAALDTFPRSACRPCRAWRCVSAHAAHRVMPPAVDPNQGFIMMTRSYVYTTTGDGPMFPLSSKVPNDINGLGFSNDRVVRARQIGTDEWLIGTNQDNDDIPIVRYQAGVVDTFHLHSVSQHAPNDLAIADLDGTGNVDVITIEDHQLVVYYHLKLAGTSTPPTAIATATLTLPTPRRATTCSRSATLPTRPGSRSTGDDHAFPRDRDRRVRGHFSVQARENAGLTLRARSRYARSISVQTRDRLQLHGASRGRRRRALGRKRRRFVRQRARREHQRPVQDRGDLATWTMANDRRRRVRDVGVGRLVQQPPPARAARLRAAGRIRRGVLSRSAESGHGGLTQENKSPENPGRFSEPRRAHCVLAGEPLDHALLESHREPLRHVVIAVSPLKLGSEKRRQLP